jgi:hypothetical protein
VLGLSVFIVQWYKQIDVRVRESRCIYNAYAGVNYAIWNYRSNPSVLTNGTTSIDANNNFTLSTVSGGTEASSLVIDATNSSRGGSGNKDILGITLTNTSPTSSITLDRIVLYVNNGNESLDRVRISGVLVRNSTDTINTTPNNLDLTTNAIIPANTTRTIEYIRFTNSFNPANLYMGFIMIDGSPTSICTVYPKQGSTCPTLDGNLTIKSMGKTAGSNQYRSVEATYNTTTGNVSPYNEISQTVP